jgi:5''-3'' exonuclease (including N-terminal domain of PolI)
MGIRKLYKFLKEKNLVKEYQNLTRYVNINKKKYCSGSIIVAIDFCLYAHKFTYSYGNMMIGFWNQIIKLLSHKIIPLYVYDGQPPDEKGAIIQYRQKKRNKMETKLHKIYDEIDDAQLEDDTKNLEKEKNRLEKSIIRIKKNDIENVKQFFYILNIPYLNATGEADALCAKLFKENIISACLSDDMDMLALGCGKTIKFLNGKVLEFDLEYILQGLELSYEQFVEMCLLFGCDYIKPTFKVNNKESYDLIKKFGSIEKILDSKEHSVLNRENEKCLNFINNYKTAKNLLMTSSINEQVPLNFKPMITKELDPFLVLKYLKTFGQLNYVTENMDRIMDSIEYINFNISKNIFNCVRI